MHSFPMSAAKHFYDNPLSIYLDPKIVLIYRPHPVYTVPVYIESEAGPYSTAGPDPVRY